MSKLNKLIIYLYSNSFIFSLCYIKTTKFKNMNQGTLIIVYFILYLHSETKHGTIIFFTISFLSLVLSGVNESLS